MPRAGFRRLFPRLLPAGTLRLRLLVRRARAGRSPLGRASPYPGSRRGSPRRLRHLRRRRPSGTPSAASDSPPRGSRGPSSPLSPTAKSSTPSGPFTVPRWALLIDEERTIAQTLARATETSEHGIVLLDDVLETVVRGGMDQQRAMAYLDYLIANGWIDQTPADCQLDDRLLGKSMFATVYGRLSAHALARVPVGSR